MSAAAREERTRVLTVEPLAYETPHETYARAADLGALSSARWEGGQLVAVRVRVPVPAEQLDLFDL